MGHEASSGCGCQAIMCHSFLGLSSSLYPMLFYHILPTDKYRLVLCETAFSFEVVADKSILLSLKRKQCLHSNDFMRNSLHLYF